ncbi:TIGR00730 family Rossman fold protein [Stappia sp. F7233]|uniref:Cytokinin riboside 5'-monophosphate phosphoribohydrolase n=1 Tax=Stappia albiluteola TaxID=2758565 RepID=A0A839AJ66_9HYPH|nr:TIGR00730 family Rossman fold protein [Stappia albiluteola]MBA5779078.1 TIGR00730 family Rossman fold protein [Stappia albiluteola]
MKSICVFCGSSFGRRPDYEQAARAMGRAIAEEGLRLVYGGAKVGLMGAVADAALAAGGEVIGVLPIALAEKELAHEGLAGLHIVGSMHERKAKMADLSDAFVALPGGTGTLEEIFEVWTWGQLGYHRKPCGFLNATGYYDQLLAFLASSVEEAFVKPDMHAMLLVEDDPKRMIDAFRAYEPPKTPKWIKRDEI